MEINSIVDYYHICNLISILIPIIILIFAIVVKDKKMFFIFTSIIIYIVISKVNNNRIENKLISRIESKVLIGINLEEGMRKILSGGFYKISEDKDIYILVDNKYISFYEKWGQGIYLPIK